MRLPSWKASLLVVAGVAVGGLLALEAYARYTIRKAGGMQAYRNQLIAKGHIDSAEITTFPLVVSALPLEERERAKLAIAALRAKSVRLTPDDVKLLDSACERFISSLNQLDQTRRAANGREFVQQCNLITSKYP
jgi:hypothetical protein